MAVDSLKGMIIAIILIGLYAVAMLSFVTFVAEENDADINITENEAVSNAMGGLIEKLNETETIANTQRNNTESDTKSQETGFLSLGSIIGSVKVFTGMFVGVFNLIGQVAQKTLNIPPLVLSVITAILIITMIFFGWRLIKVGE